MIEFFSALDPDVACTFIFCASALIFAFVAGLFFTIIEIFCS